MADNFANHSTGLDSPAGNAYQVTTSDGADQAFTTRGIYVGVAGNVKVTTAGGNAVTFVAVPAGSILPVRAARIWATGTTATNLIGMY
jgi:hypothetical protein